MAVNKPVIKLLGGRHLVADVVARWRKQYPEPQSMMLGRDSETIALALEGLPDDAPAVEIDRVIGNRSWTTYKCDHCGEEQVVAFQIGQEPDYESATVVLCEECARAARNFLVGYF